jgi:L-arabinonolactonase
MADQSRLAGLDLKLVAVGRFRAVFGESAVWCPERRGIWWVDMHGHALIFTRPDGETRCWKTPGPQLPWARAVVLTEAGKLVVALSDTLYLFDPVDGSFVVLPVDLALPPGHLFNDASVDPSGRLIIGTMLPGRGDDGKARFYRIDPNLSATPMFEAVNTTNGLAFAPDGRTIYFSDSWAGVRKVWAASYDPASGNAGAPRLFVDFGDLPGRPDGAAVDAEGGYWIAAMGTPFLHRFDAGGRLDHSIGLPVDTPTRPAFGGDGLETLYLTTGGLKGGESDDGVKGLLLAIETSFVGIAAVPMRIDTTIA